MTADDVNFADMPAFGMWAYRTETDEEILAALGQPLRWRPDWPLYVFDSAKATCTTVRC